MEVLALPFDASSSEIAGQPQQVGRVGVNVAYASSSEIAGQPQLAAHDEQASRDASSSEIAGQPQPP